jgi:SAM-dependent methyltransferase
MDLSPERGLEPRDYGLPRGQAGLDRQLAIAQILEIGHQRTLDIGQQAIGQVKVVVDVGCGPGTSLPPILRRFPEARVVGIDMADEQLTIAQNKFPNVKFHKADLRSKLPNEVADLLGGTNVIVSSRLFLGHAGAPSHRLDEMHNALGRSSALVVYEWDGPLLAPAQGWPDFDGRCSKVRDALDTYYSLYQELWDSKGNTLFPGGAIAAWVVEKNVSSANTHIAVEQLDLTVEQGINVVLNTLPKLAAGWRELGKVRNAAKLERVRVDICGLRDYQKHGLFGWKMTSAVVAKP